MASQDRLVEVDGSSLAQSALAFAVHCHRGQRRDCDGASFIEHPLEVARLLRDAGCTDVVVAAGLLHDVMEDARVSAAELTARFGADVSDLVQAVTDRAPAHSYRQRKQVLREQVRGAGEAAALLFAADKIAKVRELPGAILRDRARCDTAAADSRARTRVERRHEMRLEHYRESLHLLQSVSAGHPLVQRLADEIDACTNAT